MSSDSGMVKELKELIAKYERLAKNYESVPIQMVLVDLQSLLRISFRR